LLRVTSLNGAPAQPGCKEIIAVSGLAYAILLLTTWLPAIQSSQITPAEALFYE
jgi:ABC-type lipoprotein release transport system permease subunit